MIAFIIVTISLILDGILSNYLPYLVNDLSLFTPLFTIVSIFLIYPFFRKREKKYYLIALIIGIIYDSLYTNLLFVNALSFSIIAYITKYIHKNYDIKALKLIIYIIFIVTAYEMINVIPLIILNMYPITFQKLIYKISHSLLANIIYAEIVYLSLKIIPQKYKKISIN